jgi:hypothetical protein
MISTVFRPRRSVLTLISVAAALFGPEPACRLSITEYVGNTLLLEPR